jgi:hypothetical protein
MTPAPQSFQWEPPQAPRRSVRKTPTRTERVRDLFLAQPNVWIDGRSFETEGGCYAWRSRISDVRRQYGLVIENRQRTVRGTQGPYVISEYRYCPR